MKSGKTQRQAVIILRDLAILCVLGNGITFFMESDLVWNLRTIGTNCIFSMVIGFPAWRGSVMFTNLVDKHVPWLKNPIKRLLYQTLGLILLACIVLFVAILAWVVISEEITFENVGEYALSSLKMIIIFMLISVVLTNAVLFFINWRNAVIQQEELKRAHLALQYQSLKAQIRPHFLFNSLSSLVTLINNDPAKATQFVHRLSDVYRYVLDQSEEELIPLSEEVKFLEDYIFLQKIRFGESLQIRIDLKEDLKRRVVPLSLQMMVENAIKHNEVSADHPLSIDISSGEGNRVVIRNNLQIKKVTEESPGTGIENLSKRVAFFTDDTLSVHEDADSFTVSIPVMPA